MHVVVKTQSSGVERLLTSGNINGRPVMDDSHRTTQINLSVRRRLSIFLERLAAAAAAWLVANDLTAVHSP